MAIYHDDGSPRVIAESGELYRSNVTKELSFRGPPSPHPWATPHKATGQESLANLLTANPKPCLMYLNGRERALDHPGSAVRKQGSLRRTRRTPQQRYLSTGVPHHRRRS